MNSLIQWLKSDGNGLALLVALGVAVLIACGVGCITCPRHDRDEIFRRHTR